MKSSARQGPRGREGGKGQGLDRRELLGLGGKAAVAVAAAGAAGTAGIARAQSIGEEQPPWMTEQGAPFSGYGAPSRFEAGVAREVFLPWGEIAEPAGVSFTPLHRLTGTITPNGLHFERHHAGVPDIDPERHQLMIHGLVDRPLVYSMADLLRYPMTSRIAFIECSGNSFWNSFPNPKQADVGTLHGLVSCAEWTGIPLSLLLHEAGVRASGKWLLCEGADAAAMTRSVPLDKANDDAMIALYQNGERLRPEQGYPMRLLLPGWEGNSQIKWLRRIKLVDKPMETREETSKYADTLPDGRSRQFTFIMGAKSVITSPAPGAPLNRPGLYEIQGLAWSGHGAVRGVSVSTDGGATWAEAPFDAPPMAKALARFRLPWLWDGAPTRLISRAVDEHGNTQPDRAEWSAAYKANIYHYNAAQVWQVTESGEVNNVYI